MQQTFLLKKLKTSRMPHRFVALMLDGCLARAVAYDYEAGFWDLRLVPGLMGPLNFWAWLKQQCQCRKNVWLVGWKMYESLCHLGIYDALQSGKVWLKQKRRPVSESMDQTVWTQQAGALVCDSPPTIIDLEFGPHKYCRCIDLLNWGLDIAEFTDGTLLDKLDSTIQAMQDYVAMVLNLRMGTLSATAAGQGYTRFRTHDLSCKVAVHQDERARKLERAAYYGGRCEAMQVGPIPGPLYYVDVKAMYSSIAERERFPVDLLYQSSAQLDMPRVMADTDRYYIAHVQIETDKPRYPCRIGLHTYYPVGKFFTTLCDPELRLALENYDVVGWYKTCVYRTDYVWQNYARWYFAALADLENLGLAHMRGALKLAVNASYGKVGASGKRWVDCPADGTSDQWGQWWREHPETGAMTQGRAVNGIHQYLDQGGEPSSSIPSLAAAMPSFGRVLLWKIGGIAGWPNVFYIDTDGLVVNKAGLDGLADSVVTVNPRPGDLTVRAIADDAWIGGLKHYRLGDQWVQSGVPRDAKRTRDGRAEWMEREPFAYGLWHGKPFEVREYARTRYGVRPYEHGTVGADLRVSPLRADVLAGPDGDETVIYGRYGEIRESTSKKILDSKPK